MVSLIRRSYTGFPVITGSDISVRIGVRLWYFEALHASCAYIVWRGRFVLLSTLFDNFKTLKRYAGSLIDCRWIASAYRAT